jgi:hypothetical protein
MPAGRERLAKVRSCLKTHSARRDKCIPALKAGVSNAAFRPNRLGKRPMALTSTRRPESPPTRAVSRAIRFRGQQLAISSDCHSMPRNSTCCRKANSPSSVPVGLNAHRSHPVSPERAKTAQTSITPNFLRRLILNLPSSRPLSIRWHRANGCRTSSGRQSPPAPSRTCDAGAPCLSYGQTATSSMTCILRTLGAVSQQEAVSQQVVPPTQR